MAKVIYVTDIPEITVCDGGFRAELRVEDETLVIRGSLATLVKGHNRAKLALERHQQAEIVPLDKH